jgi:hypothetical protein
MKESDLDKYLPSMLSVVAWIKDRTPEEADALIKQIIRRVYDGKRHIHRNIDKAKASRQVVYSKIMDKLATMPPIEEDQQVTVSITKAPAKIEGLS